MRYDVVRSVSDKSLHLIFAEGRFDALPDRVRHLGPWQGLTSGDYSRLKPHYRLQIDEQGFTVVYRPVGAFSAESRADNR
jgi:hypothetical protein